MIVKAVWQHDRTWEERQKKFTEEQPA